ncbi:MAG TPA: sigma-70 family RNA polymerase sigma factor [Gemmataceae bacterium]|nr:sigma-70 family RNA polymerase sigma factor [Gemmataceae bacterium]
MPDDSAAPDASLEQMRAWLHRRAAVLLDGRLRGKVDAFDVVQDTLLKAFEHREQLRGQSAAERQAWLRQILANTLADTVRRFLAGQKRDVGREQSLDDAVRQSSERLQGWLADGRAPPADEAARNERLLGLAEGLAELPDDQREAVRRKHLHGMPVGEVARQMGKTTAAVAGLLRRGLEALRQRLGNV